MKITIVTGCDTVYAPLTKGLLASLRQFPKLAEIPINVLDFDLTDDDCASLSDQCHSIIDAQWDVDFPLLEEWKDKHPGYRGLTARPFLPRYFPDYDIYLWIDSDVWVQDPRGVLGFLKAVQTSPCVSVLEQDRSYTKYLRGDNIWRFHKNICHHLYGEKIADDMAMRPIINSGIFALRRDAPQWGIWQQTLQNGLGAMKKTDEASFLIEQCAFNIANYLHKCPISFLPATYNWSLLEALPVVSDGKLVEPSPPFDIIRNIHLTGETKKQVQKLRYLGDPDRVVETTMDFTAIKALT